MTYDDTWDLDMEVDIDTDIDWIYEEKTEDSVDFTELNALNAFWI